MYDTDKALTMVPFEWTTHAYLWEHKVYQLLMLSFINKSQEKNTNNWINENRRRLFISIYLFSNCHRINNLQIIDCWFYTPFFPRCMGNRRFLSLDWAHICFCLLCHTYLVVWICLLLIWERIVYCYILFKSKVRWYLLRLPYFNNSVFLSFTFLFSASPRFHLASVSV